MYILVGGNKIYLTDNEAEEIKATWLEGKQKIILGEEVINSSYIVGIFKGDDPDYSPEIEKREDRLISAPKQETSDEHWLRIREELVKMREVLKAKGIIE